MGSRTDGFNRGVAEESPPVLEWAVVAVILGVSLSWSGGWEWFSPTEGTMPGKIIRQGVSWLGVTAFPIGLMLIGATLMDSMGRERLSLRIGCAAVLVRIVIMPVIILLAAKFLPIAVALKQVLVVQAAMPAAVTPIIITRHYGGSPGVVVQGVLVTSMVGLFTMPLWIRWGMNFVFP